MNNDYLSTPVLVVDKLSKKYHRHKNYAIKELSFRVFPNTFHAFIGANGSGKTTTIKCIVSAYAQFEGSIYVNGISNLKANAKQAIGYIPERASFPVGVPLNKYLYYMARLSMKASAEAKKIALEIMTELNLLDLQKKSPNNFSSGQKKRVLLAQALINNPQLLVMDEPAANLDPQARIELFETAKRLQRKGKAIFISSHVLSELNEYCDTVTILDNGRIMYTGLKNIALNSSKLFYSLNTAQMHITRQILNNLQLGFRLNTENNCYDVTFANRDQIFVLLAKLLDRRICINKFANLNTSLEEIYHHYVSKRPIIKIQ